MRNHSSIVKALLLCATVASAAPLAALSREQILATVIEAEGFAAVYDALRRGDPRFGDTDAVMRILLGRPGWLNDGEAEALAEQALRSALLRQPDSVYTNESLALLVNRFAGLESWSLRALVLEAGAARSVQGMGGAVLDSGRRIAALLSRSGDGIVAEPYELEAVTLASVAAAYPALELAELLRTIASYSRHRQVVAASRSAARGIIFRLPSTDAAGGFDPPAAHR